jgi:hypothetical protein
VVRKVGRGKYSEVFEVGRCCAEVPLHAATAAVWPFTGLCLIPLSSNSSSWALHSCHVRAMRGPWQQQLQPVC